MQEQSQSVPNKRRKPMLAAPVQEQAERGKAEQPFERMQKLVEARSTFLIVTIDGGKTLNAELPMPRLCTVYE
jgi:hypothetical protein